MGDVEDLASLAQLDEKILLNELKTRYAKGRIYVSRDCMLNVKGVWRGVRVGGGEVRGGGGGLEKTGHLGSA